MIIALTSSRGSPGVSTLAVLLAELWPGEEPTWILEADPVGGILAARWLHLMTLSWEPGLLDMASSRSVAEPELLHRFSQPLTPRTRVIPAPPTPDQVRAALANFGVEGAAALAHNPAPVFVDCGRFSSGSPALPLARAAAVTAIVFRPSLEESQSVLRLCEQLRGEQLNVVLIAVGDGPYLPADVAREAGSVPCVVIADDRRSASVLHDSGPGARSFRRSALARSTRSAAEALSELVAGPESVGLPSGLLDVSDAAMSHGEGPT